VPELSYIGSELELFAHAAHWKTYLAKTLAKHVRGDVAEVGAGLGAFTKLFLTAPFRSWCCIEPDPALLAKLRAELAPSIAARRVRCVGGTLDDVDAAVSFDCILYIDVLEHIADDRAELARAARHLAPGGSLVVMSPAHGFLFSAFDRAIGHHRRYDSRSLSSIAPSELLCEDIRYLDAVGMLASLANRFLLRRSQPSLPQIQLWDRRMVPLSQRIDPVLGHRLGKSILAIWRKPIEIY
jgi:SAM-dependent methyltransferase